MSGSTLQHDDGFRFVFDDTGTFDITHRGREIAWSKGPRAEDPWVRADVTGRVLAVAMHASGHLCLHGSAVATGSGAIAFLAPKFHGKSTLALALTRAGARLLTDNVLPVDPHTPVQAVPGVHQVKLWQDRPHISASTRTVPRRVPDPSICSTTSTTTCSRTIARRSPRSICSRRSSSRKAQSRPGRALTHARRALGTRARAPLDHGTMLGGTEQQLVIDRATAIAEAVPVYQLTVAAGMERIGDTVDQLLAWHGGPRWPGRTRERARGARRCSRVALPGAPAAGEPRNAVVLEGYRSLSGAPHLGRNAAPASAQTERAGAAERQARRRQRRILRAARPERRRQDDALQNARDTRASRRGTATVGGFDVVAESSKVRSVLAPVIADERSLYWRLTAFQNLELFAKLQGMRGGAIKARVNEVLASSDSGYEGEDRRGVLERDEAAAAHRARARRLAAGAAARRADTIARPDLGAGLPHVPSRRDLGAAGVTVLLATHSADEVLELCNRVAVLDHGRLLATGTTTSLAKDLGEERYALFTRNAAHPALAALVQREVIGALHVRGEEDGWTRVEMELTGGMEHAAQIVATLVEQGVVVARFEKVPLPLADLIDRIVRRGAEEKSNA